MNIKMKRAINDLYHHIDKASEEQIIDAYAIIKDAYNKTDQGKKDKDLINDMINKLNEYERENFKLKKQLKSKKD